MEPLRYVRSEGRHLAYRVLDGTPEREVVLFTPGGTIPMDFLARDRVGRRLLDGLSAIGLVVLFDRTGIGMSDPVQDWSTPLPAQWTADLGAIVTEVCTRPPVVVSLGDFWGPARCVAADRPDAVEALVLYEPTGPVDGALTAPIDTDPAAPGPEAWIAHVCPSRVTDRAFVDWFDEAGRAGASPATAARIYTHPPEEWVERLVAAQAAIRTPTLVLRVPANLFRAAVDPDPVATAIPGAQRIDLPGTDYHWLGEGIDGLLADTSRFVTGEHRLPDAERFLAAVLFTDLVDSTGRAVAQGDAHWRVVLDRHDAVIAEEVGRRRGAIVKSTGDGVLATLPSADDAVRAAEAVRRRLADDDLSVRIGLHVGDIERRGDDRSGLAIHIAARVMAKAGAGEILVTDAVVTALQGTGRTFRPAGRHELKGVPGEWLLSTPDDAS